MGDSLITASCFLPDHVVDTPQSRVDYDRKARSAIANIAKLSKKDLLAGDPLETLDPATFSVVWVHVLLAHAGNPTELPTKPQAVPDSFRPQGELWNKTAVLLNIFSPFQVRYAGSEWRKLVDYFARCSVIMSAPGAAVVPIRNAILRLDPTAGTFTSTHITLLRLCLEARTYSKALPVLEKVIHSFPTKPTKGAETPVSAAAYRDSSAFITQRSGLSDRILMSHVQEYFLLGGMIYLGLRKYKEAHHFFEYVLSAPSSSAVSALMVEAYKKWILVGCLVKGKPGPLPKTVSGAVEKNLTGASRAYESLSKAFVSGSRAKLKAEVEVGSNWWKQDGNEGLVNLLMVHLPRFYVLNLQKTFAALPITEVAKHLAITPEKTVTYLNQLITEGYLNAIIEPASDSSDTEVLQFFSRGAVGPLGKSEEEVYRAVLEQTDRTNILVDYLKTSEHRAALSKEHIEYLKSKKGKGDGGLEDAMDTSWDAMDQPDEDMMSDLR